MTHFQIIPIYSFVHRESSLFIRMSPISVQKKNPSICKNTEFDKTGYKIENRKY
jgi:hypothetical protein